LDTTNIILAQDECKNQENNIQTLPATYVDNSELALPCGCIIGVRHCDEAKRILASGKSMPHGMRSRQLPNDTQIRYYEHISKEAQGETIEETV